MNRKLLFIPLVLFLALAAALFWQLMRNADGDDPTTLESALIGKPLPEFRLEALNTPGQTLDRRTLIDGKPLLLNVWATWCPTCRAEHQFLNGLAQQGVRVVGMNYKDDRQKAMSWLQRLGNPYRLSLSACLAWISGSMARRRRFSSTVRALSAGGTPAT